MSDRLQIDVGLGLSEEGFQRRVARVDLFEESVYLTRYEECGSGVASCYEVDPQSLAAAFAGVAMETGWLPRNTLFYRVADGREEIGVYLPAQRRQMTVVGLDGAATRHDVPLPPLVFVGRGTQYEVYATNAREWPQERERLFHAPLPNVYSDGRICQGGASFPPASPELVYEAVEAFFTRPFNFHLVNRKSQAQPDDVTAMWADAAGGDAWPLEDLIRTHKLLRDVMEGGR